MNLIELLNATPKSQFVHIGFKNGSGWVIIEKADYIINNIDGINNMYEKHIRKWYAKTKDRKDKLESQIKNRKKRIKQLQKCEQTESTKETIDSLSKIQEREQRFLDLANERIENYEKVINKDSSFANTEVVEVYKRRTGVKGICVLLDGFMAGKYWDYDEYQKDKRKVCEK